MSAAVNRTRQGVYNRLADALADAVTVDMYQALNVV